MQPKDLVVGVLAGCVLIVFGLVPGLFQALIAGIQRFRDSLFSLFPMRALDAAPSDRSRPVWLAGLGAMLIVVTVLAYLSS